MNVRERYKLYIKRMKELKTWRNFNDNFHSTCKPIPFKEFKEAMKKADKL